jgi:hypothetical protein
MKYYDAKGNELPLVISVSETGKAEVLGASKVEHAHRFFNNQHIKKIECYRLYQGDSGEWSVNFCLDRELAEGYEAVKELLNDNRIGVWSRTQFLLVAYGTGIYYHQPFMQVEIP